MLTRVTAKNVGDVFFETQCSTVAVCVCIEAVRARKSVMLPVQLADLRTVTVEADSSLTAAEACRHVATDIGLRDQFGFAIYISIYDKVTCSFYYL